MLEKPGVWCVFLKFLCWIPNISVSDFESESDFSLAWANAPKIFKKTKYLVFQWTKDFLKKIDPTFAPVWIRLPRLPLPFFNPSMLKAIGDSLGRFLCADKHTLHMNHPMAARICLEVDITVDLPKSIQLFVADELFHIQVIIVKIRFFTVLIVRSKDILILNVKSFIPLHLFPLTINQVILLLVLSWPLSWFLILRGALYL